MPSDKGEPSAKARDVGATLAKPYIQALEAIEPLLDSSMEAEQFLEQVPGVLTKIMGTGDGGLREIVFQIRSYLSQVDRSDLEEVSTAIQEIRRALEETIKPGLESMRDSFLQIRRKSTVL